jgi:hypothetical protein
VLVVSIFFIVLKYNPKLAIYYNVQYRDYTHITICKICGQTQVVYEAIYLEYIRHYICIILNNIHSIDKEVIYLVYEVLYLLYMMEYTYHICENTYMIIQCVDPITCAM